MIMSRTMNPHRKHPLMFQTPTYPGHSNKVLSPKLNHPVSKKIRSLQLKLLLHASHHHRSFTNCEKMSQSTHSNEVKEEVPANEQSSSPTTSKKIRLQQIKLLLHASHHYRALSNYDNSSYSTGTHSNEEKNEVPVIEKFFSSNTQVLHGKEPCQDHHTLFMKNEHIQEENHKDHEKEQDLVANPSEDTMTQPSSSASSFTVQSSSSLTKQELLSQLLQALSIQRKCPCKCIKKNCLLLYCECYSLRKRQKEVHQKLKLSPGLSRNANACHKWCKCQKNDNHNRSRHLLSTFSRISSHPIAASVPC
jgi:hypothetical protein